MWPSKKGLGVQLSFGVDGSSLFYEQFNDDTGWKAPREKDSGLSLSKVHRSHKSLIQPQRTSFDLNVALNEKFQSLDEEIYIPADILRSYLIESKNLLSNSVYDPSIGQLFELGEIKKSTGRNYKRVIAHATGSTGTTLNISYLTEKQKIINNGGGETSDVPMPYLEAPLSVKVNSPIKQLEFAKLVSSLEKIPPYIAIRTDDFIYLLKISIDSNESIDLELIGEICSSSLKNFAFADVSFNPWDFTQIGIVDIKGNFGIWNIREQRMKKFTRVHLRESSIYDVSELSNWKKISWSSDFNSILLFSRSSIWSYSLSTMEKKNIVTANSWSKIQDFQRCSNNYGFILTSKELICIELSNPIQRVMSWKHFLDDTDPSLKLHIPQLDSDNEMMCLIYSQAHPLVFIFQFEIKDEFCTSVKDPYFINSGFTSVTQNIIFYQIGDGTNRHQDYKSDTTIKDHEYFSLLEISTQLGISSSLYANQEKISFTKPIFPVAEYTDTDRSPSPVSIRKKFFKMFSKADLHDFASQLLKSTQAISEPQSDEIDQIQDFAYRLGERLTDNSDNVSNNSRYSMFDVCGPIGIEDIGELDSMLIQFKSFYEEKGILLEELSSNYIFKEAITLETLYQQLIILYKKDYFELGTEKAEKYIMNMAMHLGLSMVRFSSTADSYDIKGRISNRIESLPDRFQNIVDSWDSYQDVSDDEQVDGRLNQSVVTQEMPTINISQSQKPSLVRAQTSLGSNKRKGDQLLATRTNSLANIGPVGSSSMLGSQRFSQISHSQDRGLSSSLGSRNSMSQIERGKHGDKKRKKKKGGFA